MSFGLTNVLISFQRYINNILAKKLNIFVIIYLNNILIYTDNDKDSHIAAIWWIVKQMKKFTLYTNLKNCRFHQEEILFFGYVVFLKGICMEDTQIKVVKL